MITDEDFIDFACPYCGDAVSFPTHQCDSLQQCPLCGESLMAPEKPGQPGRQIPVPFSTERLILRRLAMPDWSDLLEILADEDTFRYTPGRTLDEEAIMRWLESDAHVKLTTPDQPYYLGLTLREGGKLIGYARFILSTPEPLQANIALFLNRAFQKQGFALEAFREILRFCFQGIKLHRVFATCDRRNGVAVKLLDQAGLRREGEFIKDTLHHGEWTDTLWYAALREEQASQEPPKNTTETAS